MENVTPIHLFCDLFSVISSVVLLVSATLQSTNLGAPDALTVPMIVPAAAGEHVTARHLGL